METVGSLRCFLSVAESSVYAWPSDMAFALANAGSCFGFRVSGFGLRISYFVFRVSGFKFRVPGAGIWVSGFGFRVLGLDPAPQREYFALDLRV